MDPACREQSMSGSEDIVCCQKIEESCSKYSAASQIITEDRNFLLNNARGHLSFVGLHGHPAQTFDILHVTPYLVFKPLFARVSGISFPFMQS